MPRYTMHLVLKEVYTCEYEVEAEDEDGAINQITNIEKEYGIDSDETQILNWNYYETDYTISEINCKEEILEYIEQRNTAKHERCVKFKPRHLENYSGESELYGYEVYINGEETDFYISKNYRGGSSKENYEAYYEGSGGSSSKYFNKLRDAKKFIISLATDKHYETGNVGERSGDDPELEQWTEEKHELEFSSENLENDEKADWKKEW